MEELKIAILKLPYTPKNECNDLNKAMFCEIWKY